MTKSPPNRTLWLLRHAKAVADPPPDGDDFDRILAPRGQRDATALGRLIGPTGQGLGLGQVPLPQLALVSPAARTAATAELVLAGTGDPTSTVTQSPAALYGAAPYDVLEYVRAVSADVTSVMVVGHNPTAHALAAGLLSHEDRTGRDLVVRRGFPTCALGVYRLDVTTWAEVEGQCATLLGLFIPPFGEG